jgi:RNA polymerase sigma-70 factor (ECF subfamily)
MATAEPFDELYVGWFDRIHAWVRARVADRTQVEDLTQEIFLAIFQSRASFTGRSDFDAWVFGVARNVLRSHRRAERRRAERDVAPSDESSPTLEDQVRARRRLAVLVEALRETRAADAELFAAHFVDLVPVRELARRSGRSRHALRSSLYRVRRRLERGELG